MIRLTISQIIELGIWDDYCDLVGWDYYCYKEGKVPDDEVCHLTIMETIELLGPFWAERLQRVCNEEVSQ